MEVKTRNPSAKTCDSCNMMPATVFCRHDSAFFCSSCDVKVHSASMLASPHCRVWVCEVCEQAPSTVTCKADAAVLCATCDHDIHTANPLARRHQRLPVTPFYHFAAAAMDDCCELFDEKEEEEQLVSSWLLPNPNGKAMTDYLFSDVDPFLDLDSIYSYETKPKIEQQKQYSSDGVVPENHELDSGQVLYPIVDGFPAGDMDPPISKFFLHSSISPSINHTASSSSLEVGVVPKDISPLFDTAPAPFPVSGDDREARVLRYKEKKKNRRFEKTIRYASRKAYAETRPRIKGRFAKQSELELDSFIAEDSSFFVVPGSLSSS